MATRSRPTTLSPTDEAKRGGVVVIHHMPGYDRATKEIARRFAELGYDAVMPNLYWREARRRPRRRRRHGTGPGRGTRRPPHRRRGRGGGWLRALPASTARSASSATAPAGRQSVLAACNLDLDAAVDCYGAFVIGTPPEGFPLKVPGLVDQVPNLRCPSARAVRHRGQVTRHRSRWTELEQILKENGKEYEFHSYEDAGHAFFSVDRPSYNVAAANDGWERIETFYAKHLGG